MARLDALPAVTTIAGMKGLLDYAVWRGIPYVRSWPRKPPMPRAPAVQASAARMTEYIARLRSQAPELTTAGRIAAEGTSWTWRDATITAAFGHLVRPPE